MEKKSIISLHEDHKEWSQHLKFYREDLKIYEIRIAEVAAKNSSRETLAMVEHFQNALKVQFNNIDELQHRINEHENYLVKNIKENEIASDHRKLNDHPKMREDFNGLEKIINDLRFEVNKFASKWL